MIAKICSKKTIRRLLILWIVALITMIAWNTTSPEHMEHVNASVATIATAIIGLFSVILGSLCNKDNLEG